MRKYLLSVLKTLTPAHCSDSYVGKIFGLRSTCVVFLLSPNVRRRRNARLCTDCCTFVFNCKLVSIVKLGVLKYDWKRI
jgi:hypothetical protein